MGASMRWKWGVAAVLAVVGLAAGGLAARDVILMRMIAWTAPKVGAHRPTPWMQGPATAAAAPADRPPNIVLILADDLGVNDISLNGGGLVPTPHIDALGREGAVMGQGYASHATCAPSRAALMTGRYPTRYGFEFTPAPPAMARFVARQRRADEVQWVYHGERARDVPPLEQMGVPGSEITLAELLEARGYHTVHLGKWHLGAADGMRPEDQGFAESLGFMPGGQMYLPERSPDVVNARLDFDPLDKALWVTLPYSVQYNGGQPFRPDGYMTDYLSDQAVEAIRASRNRPFFLYVAYNAPHTPLQALKADYDRLAHIPDHRARVYAAMVMALDRGVGRIMQALKAQGLDDNTLVIFTSDNGGTAHVGLPGLNDPYRGWKLTFFEGGLRAPYLMRWPARIPAGSTFDRPVSHLDVFATAAGAAGAAPPADRVMDGIDLAPFLRGERPGADPHAALFWRSGGYRAVRAGNWKLQVLDEPRRVWLFDLAADPTERRDLAEARPDVVAALRARLDAHDREQAAPAWPALVSAPVGVDKTAAERLLRSDDYVMWSN